MKKLLLLITLFIFHFSFCFAQDTLVYKNGEKVGVKIVELIGNKIVFTKPPSDTLYKVNQSNISYIIDQNSVKLSFRKLWKKIDSTEKANNAKIIRQENPDYRPININAGIGGSLMELAVPGNNLIGGGGPSFLSQSPTYNCTIDYRVITRLSIGAGGAYQWFTDNPGYGQSETATWETEKITRYNLSWLVLYHFSKKI